MLTWFFHSLFASIQTTLMLAGVGAVIGLLSFAAGRLVGGLWSAVIGALLVVGVYGSGYLSAHNDAATAAQIAQLEADKAKLEHDAQALRDVREIEQVLTLEQQKKLEEQEKQMDEIQKVIDAHKADDKCDTGAFADELDAIRKLK